MPKLTSGSVGTLAAVTDDDYLYIVNDPGGSAGSYKATRAALLSGQINTAGMSTAGAVTGSVAVITGTVSCKAVTGSVGTFTGPITAPSGSITTLTGDTFTAAGTVSGSVAIAQAGSITTLTGARYTATGTVAGSVALAQIGSVTTLTGARYTATGTVAGSVSLAQIGSVTTLTGARYTASGTVAGSVGLYQIGSITTLTGTRYTATGTVAGTAGVYGSVTINSAQAVYQGGPLGAPASGDATNLTNKVVLGTPVDLTNSGANDLTQVTFGSIPAGTKKIVITLDSASSTNTASFQLTIGDSGGLETSGYAGTRSSLGSAVTSANFTGAFTLTASIAATTFVNGSIYLDQLDASNNQWQCTWQLGLSDSAALYIGAGDKALSAELTQLSLSITVGTFDSGNINIAYQG